MEEELGYCFVLWSNYPQENHTCQFFLPYLQDYGFLRTRNLLTWQREVTNFSFFFNFADTYDLTVALAFKETPWTTTPLHVGIPALLGKTVLDHITCVLGTAVSSVN